MCIEVKILRLILKTRPNVLILDEPTNHMDIVGKETFEEMLRSYTGTVIVVSHDRYLINKVCDRILGFHNGGAEVFDGTYEEYESKLLSLPQESEKEEKAPKKKPSDYKNSPQKEQERRLRRVAQLEKKITENEAILSKKQEELNSPDVFSDYKKILELQAEIETLTAQNEELFIEWSALSEE